MTRPAFAQLAQMVRNGGLREELDVVLDLAHTDGFASRGQKSQDVEPGLVGKRLEQPGVRRDVLGRSLARGGQQSAALLGGSAMARRLVTD